MEGGDGRLEVGRRRDGRAAERRRELAVDVGARFVRETLVGRVRAVLVSALAPCLLIEKNHIVHCHFLVYSMCVSRESAIQIRKHLETKKSN